MRKLCLLVPLILAGCDTPPADTPQIGWDAVPALLDTCTVTGIYQGHNLWVVLTTSDGAQVAVKEPGIDDIFTLMRNTGCPADQEITVVME